MQRSISLPVEPYHEEYKPCLERSKEIEELREELREDDDLCECSSEHISDSNNLDFEEFISIRKSESVNEDMLKSSNENCHGDDEFSKETEQDAQKQENLQMEKKKGNKMPRIIKKSGERNMSFSKIPRRSLRYCQDLVNTLIEQKWRYTLTVFLGTFVLSWIVFTLLWYLVAYAHGDLLFDENGERLGEGGHPCIIGVKSLLDIFIFTVETQTTIGFGEKYSTEECPEGVFLFLAHVIVSIGLEGAIIGIIYAKMSCPAKYTSGYKFSKIAVICYRDEKLCFIFRVCDPGENQTIGTKISAFVLMDTQTTEGEYLMKAQKELKISGSTSPIIVWPETICHVIDETSPLIECIEGSSFVKNFEIYVSLVGSSPSMGQVTESKTSYLPCEIHWNHRFANIVMYDWEKDNYFIDYDHFDTIIQQNVPNEVKMCGAFLYWEKKIRGENPFLNFI